MFNFGMTVTSPPPFFWGGGGYAGFRAILSGIPDAEVRYAGCHLWGKLDSDAMK